METDGLDLLRGEARFTGPMALAVALDGGEGVALSADLIVLDDGERPAMTLLPGLGDVPALDSTSIMELAEVSEQLLVLGGGSVGVEFAQMFRRFGGEVTVVQRGPHLPGGTDAEVGAAVEAILRDDGLDLRIGAGAVRVAPRAETGGVRLTIIEGNGERGLDGRHLRVAVGRTPNTDRLGAGAAGVARDERGSIMIRSPGDQLYLPESCPHHRPPLSRTV